mmetsp:Transcript_136029/g.236355  ORF Transcript_136029/g.236355 Transcript_136029/m.236355 type:complete len:565 (+) Transcript_136029:52-1746(+)
MTQLITALAPVVLLFSVTRQVQGKGFLVARHNHSELEDSPATDGELRRDLRHAVSTASRCGYSHGSHIPPGAGEGTQQVLRHMWQALPHTKQNRIGAKSLCYLMQRYFIRSGLLIRDLQPGSTGVTDKPCRLVSLYAESVLQGGHELKDFSLDDATTMVAAIEDLLLHSDTELLEAVYGEMDVSLPDQVPHDTVKLILENYMVHWLMGHDEEGIQLLLENRSLLEEIFPHWGQLAGLAEGRVRSMAYSRAMVNVFASGYSFDEVQQIVGGITRSFGFFWQSECTRLKDLLLDLDTDKDGRVPLASFYNVGATSEWRLGESEAYLRELGVLDETSRWRGKQVIIPNYMQAASNCIVTTHHYLICCMSECEAIIDEIEASIGKPVAMPEQVLAVMQNVTVEASSLEGAGTRPKVAPKLVAQLKWIATSNGGRILLHGRLFAQWLHYLFPQECPFPHIQGSTKAMTPSEFGETYIATEEEMRLHTENSTASNMSLLGNEENVLSLWSAEEEFVVDYAPHHFDAVWGLLPWSRHLAIFMLSTAILLLGIVGAGHHAESAGPKMLKEYF